MTTTPSRRTLLRAAAWTAPAVTVAAAAPAYATSTGEPDPQLGVRISGPTNFGGTTGYTIWFTNAADTAIPAGQLIVTLPNDPSYFYSGFSGDVRWSYGPDDPNYGVTFAYNDVLVPDDESGVLLLIVGRTDAQAPVPTATAYATAPGHAATPVSMELVY